MPRGVYPRKQAQPKSYPAEMVAEITRLYEAGRSQAEIASAIGCGSKVVWRVMKNHGIAARCSARRRIRNHAQVLMNVGTGWIVSCQCGWSALAKTATEARATYCVHFNEEYGRPDRECGDCGQRVPLAEMSVGKPSLCKPCSSGRVRAWADRNPGELERQKRRSHLRRKFGITLEQYEELFADQGGVCAICGLEPADPRGFSPHIDHCHATGRIRGVLCQPCNNGIGSLRDDPEVIARALAYVLRFQNPAAGLRPAKKRPPAEVVEAVRAQIAADVAAAREQSLA